ncbi:SDR family NAD(P)-dependent oxidoreductase [Janthinobacterium sp. PC23-8]|uniref:SDR family NAD(P)-dependent oxidoreductase n=1 Tax=Janthinobacterium sp. PC23-8 TaxID=2012679 RepID=UPI000B96B162|nr:SDR family NAD(P)-dependent oxidoreductase [Janthinobacterium sp. PC23-8]OYO30699.1 short-chain dehydrogenase [Janthinobacterium sp. PC23-8]
MPPNKPQRIVIIGATSAIAEHCARLWVSDTTVHLTLVGRSVQRTQQVADDLQVRSPQSRISVREADFMDADGIAAMAAELAAQGQLDVVLIAHGSLPDQAQCQTNLAQCREALEVNAISPVLFAEAFVEHMQRSERGTLAIIGSVAGDRGRKSNYVYGAAKGLVTRYAQGLQHRLASSGLTVVLIKPGPTATPMTAHLPGQGKMAPVEQVAREIVAGIARGAQTIYTPGKWAVIMQVIRHLPRFVFNKMDI